MFSVRPKPTIIARVNGFQITRDDFIGELKQIHLYHQRSYSQAGSLDISAFLNDLINKRLFIQEAKRMGLDQESGFQKALAQARIQVGSEAERRYRDNLLYHVFLKKIIILQAKKVSGEEIERYYRNHPSLFRTDTSVYLEQIVVKDPNSAYQVYHELRQGANFDFLARENSLKAPDVQPAKWVSLQKMQPRARALIERLGEGQISRPVEFGGGYFIFRVKRKKGGEHIPLERVRKQVEKKVTSLKFHSTLRAWIQRLRKVSSIFIDERALQKLTPE